MDLDDVATDSDASDSEKEDEVDDLIEEEAPHDKYLKHKYD